MKGKTQEILSKFESTMCKVSGDGKNPSVQMVNDISTRIGGNPVADELGFLGSQSNLFEALLYMIVVLSDRIDELEEGYSK